MSGSSIAFLQARFLRSRYRPLTVHAPIFVRPDVRVKTIEHFAEQDLAEQLRVDQWHNARVSRVKRIELRPPYLFRATARACSSPPPTPGASPRGSVRRATGVRTSPLSAARREAKRSCPCGSRQLLQRLPRRRPPASRRATGVRTSYKLRAVISPVHVDMFSFRAVHEPDGSLAYVVEYEKPDASDATCDTRIIISSCSRLPLNPAAKPRRTASGSIENIGRLERALHPTSLGVRQLL